MGKYQEIKIPQLGVNDEFANLVEWYFKDKDHINVGDIICTIETSKAAVDLVAEREGYLRILVETDNEVRIKDAIAVIAEEKEIDLLSLLPQKQLDRSEEKEISCKDEIKVIKVKATGKARILAAENNIDLSLIKKKGIIREKDVMNFMSSSKDRVVVAIYGAGKGGKTYKEAIELSGQFKVGCFLDDHERLIDKEFEGIKVKCGSNLNKLKEEGYFGVACAIASAKLRREMIDRLEEAGLEYINLIHPHTFIAHSVKLGKGNFIKAGVIIDTDTVIGNACIIDNNVTIAHDNIIEDGCHLAPGVTLGSSIRIEENSIIGIGSSISTKINIGKNVIISVGSSVTMDIEDNSIVEGVPGKIIGKRKQ